MPTAAKFVSVTLNLNPVLPPIARTRVPTDIERITAVKPTIDETIRSIRSPLGCQTCECEEEIRTDNDGEPKFGDCSPMKCSLDCKYGFQRDLSGCPLCSCNVCPLQTCRMFCMYGFKKNSDGCDLCECDWAPVAENIPCSDVRANEEEEDAWPRSTSFS